MLGRYNYTYETSTVCNIPRAHLEDPSCAAPQRDTCYLVILVRRP